MPLWTIAISPELDGWGWAFVSVTSPCVAQRVWPIPTTPESSSSLTILFTSKTLPTPFLTNMIIGKCGNAYAVISSVFHSFESFYYYGCGRTETQVSYDRAHIDILFYSINNSLFFTRPEVQF